MSLKLKLKNVPRFQECEKCRELFKSSIHLKHHRLRIHNRRRPYVCRDCHKSFRRVQQLQEHSRSHKTDAFITCSVCDLPCPNRQILVRHVGSHVHYAGDHECGYCSASFLSLAEARLHVLLVHDDRSVLPPIRQRKSFENASHDDGVFCVKGGDGLKLKLKRKMSLSGTDDHQTNDWNPGSQATVDSGQGNSDMDDEEGHKSGNPLLKTPTFLPQHIAEQKISAISKPLFQEPTNGLIMKPKFEVNSVSSSFRSSKFQSRLDSSDLLSKFQFTPTTTSQQQSQQSSNTGLFSSSKNATMLNTNSSFGSNSLFGSQSMTFNGHVYKPSNPALFPNSGQGSSSLNFGTNSLSFTSATSGSFGISNNSFGSSGSGFILASTGFGQTASGFGQTASGFGSHATGFGKAPNVFGPQKDSFGSSGFAPRFGHKTGSGGLPKFNLSDHPKNGFITSETAIFGSKEKVEQNMAKASEEIKSVGFEQYAQNDGNKTYNIFAAAMLNAKNPPKHVDNDVLSDSISESELEDSGLSDSNPPTDSEENISQSEAEKPQKPSSPCKLPSPRETPRSKEVTPQHKGATPIYLPSPARNNGHVAKSPATRSRQSSHSQSPQSFKTPPHIPTPKHTPVRETAIPDYLMNGSLANDIASPIHKSELYNGFAPSPAIKPKPSHSTSPKKSYPRRSSTQSTTSVIGDVSANSTPQHTGTSPVRSTEPEQVKDITYHLDLDVPVMSISVLRTKIKQTNTHTTSSSKRSRSRHASSKTPLRSDMMSPPSSHDSVFVTQLSPRFRAPTKPTTQLKAKRIKPKIGPKSYMRRMNGVVYKSDEESKKLSLNNSHLFYTAELEQTLSSGRTDCHAPCKSSFHQNQKYLCYLRLRALDLVLSLFPNIHIGGNFCKDSDDVEGLLDYITNLVKTSKPTSRRCIDSEASKRKDLNVRLVRSTKYTVRNLQRKVCALIQVVFPNLNLEKLQNNGISTLPKLIHKVVAANS